jgi:hypothetical protein
MKLPPRSFLQVQTARSVILHSTRSGKRSRSSSPASKNSPDCRSASVRGQMPAVGTTSRTLLPLSGRPTPAVSGPASPAGQRPLVLHRGARHERAAVPSVACDRQFFPYNDLRQCSLTSCIWAVALALLRHKRGCPCGFWQMGIWVGGVRVLGRGGRSRSSSGVSFGPDRVCGVDCRSHYCRDTTPASRMFSRADHGEVQRALSRMIVCSASRRFPDARVAVRGPEPSAAAKPRP